MKRKYRYILYWIIFIPRKAFIILTQLSLCSVQVNLEFIFLFPSLNPDSFWKHKTAIHLHAWLNPVSHRKVFLPYEPFYISKHLPLPMKIIACSSFHLCILEIQFPFSLSFIFLTLLIINSVVRWCGIPVSCRHFPILALQISF